MKAKTIKFTILLSMLTVLLIFSLAVLESCSTTAATKITGSWKDPEAKAYKDFFVAVLSKNLPARSTLERDISGRLKHEGVKVSQSMELFPHSEKLETAEEKKAAVEQIQSLGHDAIITVVLVNHTEEDRYVPGASSYAPTNVGYGSGYYSPTRGGTPTQVQYGSGNFGNFYTNASTTYTTPGYYEVDKTYYLESRIYDVQTSKLVWSAQSETFNPGNLSNASGDFSQVMVEAMKKAKLIYMEEKGKK